MGELTKAPRMAVLERYVRRLCERHEDYYDQWMEQQGLGTSSRQRWKQRALEAEALRPTTSSNGGDDA